jgi:hypothetical protein
MQSRERAQRPSGARVWAQGEAFEDVAALVQGGEKETLDQR